MSFFDSKEEVINIELTQKGKHLLSKGKFRPKYYAFFDDDILYDSEYGNLSENQNESQDRILEETAYSKPQSNFSSVDLRNNELDNIILMDDINVTNNIEKGTNLLPYSIGTSDYNSNFAPAWNIEIINGEIIDYSLNFINSDNSNYTYTFLKIPQINLKDGEIELYTSKRSERDFNERVNVFLEMPEESYFDVMSEEKNLSNIIQVIEKNTQDNNKNFDIEFFIEEKGEWKSLKFFKEVTNIKNNILLDEYINLEVTSKTIDEECVEYYFEVLFDEFVAIPDEKMQSLSTIYNSPISDKFEPFGDDC